jgi:glycerol-3-phosphate dehydrogenase
MACCLADFFIRRTGMLFFDIDKIEKSLPVVTDEWTKQLALDETQLAKQFDELDRQILAAKDFWLNISSSV